MAVTPGIPIPSGPALLQWARDNGWTQTQSATTGAAVKYGQPVWKENRGTDTEKNIGFGITQDGQAYNIMTGNPVTLMSDGKAVDNVTGQPLAESPNQNHVIRNIGLAALGIAGGLTAASAIAGAGGAAGGGATGGAIGPPQAAVNSTAAAASGGAGAGAGTGAAAGGFGKFATDTAKALTALNFGNAQGRVAEAQANIEQHNALLNEMALNLRKATNQQEATGIDYNRQVRGGLLEGLQDANIQAPPGVHVGTVTGGLRPSAITGAPQIGSDIQRAATLDLLGKGDPNYGGVTALSGITAPPLPPLPTPNVGQKILGGIAPILNVGGSAWNWLNAAKPVAQIAKLPSVLGYNTMSGFPNIYGTNT